MSYAWLMVALTFFTQFLCMGFTFYSFGVILKPLADEFGGGRLGVTMLPLAMSLAGGVMAPVVGRRIARGSIRNVMALGCLVMGVGFLGCSQATQLWQLALLFGSFLSFGVTTMGGVTSQALVVNWFERDRTIALGVSLMGVSLSGMLMAHVTTALVGSGGWRWAFEVFGWMCLLATPVVWLLVVSRPEEHPSSPPTSTAAPSAGPTSTWAALHEPNLWTISLIAGLAFMGTTAVMTHAVAFGTDAGFSAKRAAWILSVLAGGAAAGKLVFGWLARRIGERGALAVSLGTQALGILGLASGLAYAPLIGVCVILGLGVGGVMPLAAALLARAFGPGAFGPMMGLMTPILIPFQAVGAPLAGWVFDSTGSYVAAWWVLAGVTLLAGGLLFRLRLEAE